MKLHSMVLLAALAAVGSAYGQGMAPNQEPAPSPSDMRAQRGQDGPDGQSPEARTPSPSDLAVTRPRADGDLPRSGIQEPRNAAAGGTGNDRAPAATAGTQQPTLSPAEASRTY